MIDKVAFRWLFSCEKCVKIIQIAGSFETGIMRSVGKEDSGVVLEDWSTTQYWTQHRRKPLENVVARVARVQEREKRVLVWF